MHVISIFDFLQSFDADRRIAVIGNAPGLEDSGLGRQIDDYDIVIRFNDCRVRGYEADVGRRTDILICNPYAETRPGRRLSDEVMPTLVLVLSPQTRRGDQETFEKWIGNIPCLFSWVPDIRIKSCDRHDIALTTGTYGLSLVYNVLKPRELFIAGFTMFSPGAAHHYWTSESPSGLGAHNPDREAILFADLLNTLKCPTILTNDVFGIFQRSRITPKRAFRLQGEQPMLKLDG